MVGGGRHTSVTAVLLPPGARAAGSICRLDDDEAHHLRVRRISVGDTVDIRDGAGLTGSATVTREGDAWAVEIVAAGSVSRPPGLVLAVGAGDRDRFAWLVEKASELGATAVIPIETVRAAGVATRLASRHLDKLRRRALEAIKQSGAAWATTVEEPISLERFLSAARPDLKWLADPAGEAPPATLGSESVTVVVGPEGGLTGGERETAMAAGYRPVKLGAHTLRFETAALAAAVAVNAGRLRGIDG